MSIKNKKKAKINLKERIKKVKLKTKKFWEKYEIKIIMAAGLILVSVISFEAGVLKGQDWKQAPLIIEKTAECPAPKVSGTQGGAENLNINRANNAVKKECVFVGSKNSNKYHLPGCRYAKRIKPENIVCFSSEEDARNKGYVPAGCCAGKK